MPSDIITRASHQWATRPDDERYESLIDMRDHFEGLRERSRQMVVSSRRINVEPDDDHRGMLVRGPNGHAYAPTNWAFGQLCTLSEAPAGYLRSIPAPIAADCINYGLSFKRDISDIGVLLQATSDTDVGTLRAATGPRYGRVWNRDIVNGLIDRFGDGVNGDWRVPGEFGKRVVVNKSNTTLYASDGDMFVFLADEDHRITIPNRRNGKPGSLARGFFVWNSEVGAATLGIATFLFDYVCMNRIIWGAAEYKEIRIRHTVSAPDRWLEEVEPGLREYANSSSRSITKAIEDARSKTIGDKLDAFLSERFSRGLVQALKDTHIAEEGRPIETLWDATVAATAYARSIPFQDTRIDLERKAGDLLTLAA